MNCERKSADTDAQSDLGQLALRSLTGLTCSLQAGLNL